MEHFRSWDPYKNITHLEACNRNFETPCTEHKDVFRNIKLPYVDIKWQTFQKLSIYAINNGNEARIPVKRKLIQFGESLLPSSLEGTTLTYNQQLSPQDSVAALETTVTMSGITLYSVSDSPPTTGVKLGLRALGLTFNTIDVDFAAGEHLSEEFAKKNPQMEIPCLDDNGFLLSESIAILQYLADKYDSRGTLYPKEPQSRAVVNHRLAFNISTYYRAISEHVMAPIFFAYERTPQTLNKLNIALNVFNTILERQGTTYASGNVLTIADLALVSSTMCLEAIDFSLQAYTQVQKWYDNFKNSNRELWLVAEPAMKEITYFNSNPPDLSKLVHPYHPVRKP